MERQQSLFSNDPDMTPRLDLAHGTTPPHTLARATHPETSKQAAKVVAENIAERQQEALAWLKKVDGCTQRELDEFATGGRRVYSKRLNELERLGLARRGCARPCRYTGETVETWWVV